MKKWVAALRSGKFKKGVDCLQSGPHHRCCLGVLCEIAPKSVRVERDGFGMLDGDELSYQPRVLKWSGFGFGNVEGRFGDTVAESLTYLNDQTENSFEDIADVIEREWENL